jgi:diacylglycerol kinase (ATP)
MYYYIINPSSGGGKINKVQDKLRSRLRNLGIAGEFVKSTGPGDIPRLTKMGIEKGYNTIVAVGGDGTINEVINALPDESTALGIIPMGNTNELANLLGINDWNDACTILAARKVEIVDLGKIEDKIFVTSVSVGFETILFDLKKFQPDNLLSKTAFYTKLLKEAKKFKPVELELEFGEKYTVNTECFNFSISNGKFSNFLPQNAKPQDNMLDAVLINKLSQTDIIKYATGKINLSHNKSLISVFHTQKVTIKTPKPIPVSADGFIVANTPVTIRLAEKKLKVIVSKKRHF